ncbi:MAG TPA: hypothetical protein VGO73_14525 [Pyrinomonadaceae bacterium]|jgi:hypothetical protein|nr:hypothetical protein [Pyrinomonadaceae bacterium]
MLIRQLALVSDTKKVSFSAVSRVGAALQKQATRDLASIWQVKATVDSFARLEDVPVGYWPIIITDDDLGSAAGIHEDKQGQPFALVKFDNGWALTASHESCEMLVDPFGNRLMPGQSPMKDQGRVEFLVEVCDPSEDTPFAYRVNGIVVSDFYTPNYFDPVRTTGVRYSFTGAITAPRQVLKNGYLSWHDPVSDHWFQQTFFTGSKPAFRDIGKIDAQSSENLRAMLYKRTPERYEPKRFAESDVELAVASMTAHAEAATARAESLRKRIAEVRENSK